MSGYTVGTMHDDEFTKLFKYMTERFDRVDATLADKASAGDMHRLLGLVDEMVKRQEISDDERLVMAHQLTQLHDWVEQAAKRIDVKFAH
jgi:hypothetical protein